MKKLSLKPAGGGERRERNALKGGAYSLAVVAVVLAIERLCLRPAHRLYPV